MTRDAVHHAIEFQGVIEGCPDHQWLLTDALFETGKTPVSDSDPRWVVLSHHRSPSATSPNTLDCQKHYQVRDLQEGWSMSASSAFSLAQRIRQHFSDSGLS